MSGETKEPASAGGTTGPRSKGSSGDFRVVVRIRPLSEKEIEGGQSDVVTVVQGKVVTLREPPETIGDPLKHHPRVRDFAFDDVFGHRTDQSEIFEATTKPLVSSVLGGYHATVFAYGATGSGKTYSMLGNGGSPGVIPRTIAELFRQLQSNPDVTVSLRLSFLEVYNETLRDLLDPDTSTLQLLEDKGVMKVLNLSEVVVESADQVMALLQRGNANRTEAPTAANPFSSRSHAVCQLSVEVRPRLPDVTIQVRSAKLNLVDLAGSERAAM